MKTAIYLRCLLVCAALAAAVSLAQAEQPGVPAGQRFAIYYSPRDDLRLSDFDLLVLDSDAHPSIAAIRKRAPRKQKILGYVALCEVGPGKPYKADLARAGLILGAQPRWPGTSYIDIRRPAWRDWVLQQLVPSLLAQGFDGLFLDTIDDAPWLDSEAPGSLRAPGSAAAAVSLVRAIRTQFPGRPIMLNRGFELMNRVAPFVDMILAESTYARWSDARPSGTLVSAAEHAANVRQLVAIRAQHPRLQIYTLDYWDTHDITGIARIYSVQRALGFLPYVATRDLDVIVTEPRG